MSCPNALTEAEGRTGARPSNPGLTSGVYGRLEVVTERRVSTHYARPYVVPERLDELTGPTSGVVWLPGHLDWSGNAVYDLDSPGRIIDLYRTVLMEAADRADLAQFLNAGMLRRLWAMLWLPQALRAAWEARFADLALLRELAA